MTPVPFSPADRDETYEYDENGNRELANGLTYENDSHNRLVSDGVFSYQYDTEGNRMLRYRDADQNGQPTELDTDVTEYAWDHRNRLVQVVERDHPGSSPTKIVTYTYDVYDRWIATEIDHDGNGTVDRRTGFVYDGDQILLQFEDADGAGPQPTRLSHRYLHGPAVDQILAAEEIPPPQGGTWGAGDMQWPLTDHLGTVRVLADAEGTVAHLRVFDAFGAETNPQAVDFLFGFTGRPYDKETRLQNNLHRWYDPAIGRWLSEDPIGFDAGDPNLYRYVENGPTNAVDPSGQWIWYWFPRNPTLPVVEPPTGVWKDGAFAHYRSREYMAMFGFLPQEIDFINRGGGCYRLAQVRLGLVDRLHYKGYHIFRATTDKERFFVPFPHRAKDVHLFASLGEADEYFRRLQREGKDPRMFAVQMNQAPTGRWPPEFEKDRLDGYKIEVHPYELTVTDFNFLTRHWRSDCGRWYWEWQAGPGGDIAHSYGLAINERYTDVVYGVINPPDYARDYPILPAIRRPEAARRAHGAYGGQ